MAGGAAATHQPHARPRTDQAAYRAVFTANGGVGAAANLEGGAALSNAARKQLQAGYSDALAKLTVRVDHFRFLSPTQAALQFDLLLNGQPVTAATIGQAAFVKGKWKVAGATFCSIVTRANVPAATAAERHRAPTRSSKFGLRSAGPAPISTFMISGTGKLRWALTAIAVSTSITMGTATAAGAAPHGSPTVNAFTTGTWGVHFNALFYNSGQGVDSVVTSDGNGTANVEQGHLTATCTATGTVDGTVTIAGATHSANGAITFSNCGFAGPATAPVWSATTGFAGSVDGGGVSSTFGPISSTLRIDSATKQVVTGEWTDDLRANSAAAGVDATGPASFVAIKGGACPTTGPKTPRFPTRVRNGSPDAPTTVRVVVDPSVGDDKPLNDGLRQAITTWNATLEAAGRNIEFTTVAGAGPTVHIAVDGPVRSSLGIQEPVDPKHAGETTVTDDSGGVVNTAVILLKSPGLSATEPWDQVNAQLIEHVMLHELGHVLGLDDHSDSNTDSIMWGQAGTLRGYHPITVSCGDIRALQAL